jgi:CRISPR type IV-associated protein Csf3
MSKHYRITFRLAAPCVFIDRPIFDSILAYALWREENPTAAQKLSYTDEEVEAFNAMLREKLPLAWSEHGYPLASLLQFESVNEEIAYKRKKWDAQHDSYADFGKHKRQVRVNGGQYKSYELPRVTNIFASPHKTLPFSQFGHVWFDFVSGDVVRVRELLDGYVAGIGKDVQQGKGRWSEYCIEEIAEPFVPCMMRPVPESSMTKEELTALLNAGRKVSTRLMAWRPPYWDARQAVVCVLAE